MTYIATKQKSYFNIENALNDAVKKFKETDMRHNQLMSVAIRKVQQLAKGRKDAEERQDEILEQTTDFLFDMYKEVREVGSAEYQECEDTARHALEEYIDGEIPTGRSTHLSAQRMAAIKAKDQSEWMEWVRECIRGWSEEDVDFDDDDEQVLCEGALKALEAIMLDNHAKYFLGGRPPYMETCKDAYINLQKVTWGGIRISDLSDKPQFSFNPLGDTPNENGGYRYQGNVKRIDWILMEGDEALDDIDAKMGTEEYLDERCAQQRVYFKKLKARLSVGTCTYSGNKSIHMLVRVDTTVEEYKAKLPELERLFVELRLDPVNLDYAHRTRMPNARRWFYRSPDGVLYDMEKCDDATCAKAKDEGWEEGYRTQYCYYVDPMVEPMTLDELIQTLQGFVDEFSPDNSPEDAIELDLPVYPVTELKPVKDENGKPVKDENGNPKTEEVSHYTFDYTKWEGFLRQIGVKYLETGPSQYSLAVSSMKGITELKSPEDVGNYICRRMAAVEPGAAAFFRENRMPRLKRNQMAEYAGLDTKLNLTHDTKECVYVPFANGLLEIRKDEIKLNKGYCGYDILRPKDKSTLDRAWMSVEGKSEFETFLEHACGSEEPPVEEKKSKFVIFPKRIPLWELRKKAFMCLLGYLVCRYKEAVNWLCILTDESNSENMGRTGKSLIASAVQTWRSRWFKDMRRVSVNSESMDRFLFAGFPDDGADYIQFDDMPESFDYGKLFAYATEGITVENKGQNPRQYTKAESPKYIFSTNFYPRGLGSASFDGRIKIYEVSNHYTPEVTPETELGHRIFDDWDAAEWSRFDNFMASCVQMYMKEGLVTCPCLDKETKQMIANVPLDLQPFYDKFTANNSGEISNTTLEANYYQHTGGKPTYKLKSLQTYLANYCRAVGLEFTPSIRMYDNTLAEPKRLRGFRISRPEPKATPKPESEQKFIQWENDPLIWIPAEKS